MRIVIVTSAHPSSDKRVFQRHALFLREAGHDVHLIAPTDEGDFERAGVSIHGFPAPRSKVERLSRLPTIFRLAQALRGDLYHLHDPDLLAIGWMLRLSLNIPVVYDAHEDFSVERNVRGVSGRASRLLSRVVGHAEELLARRVDAVVCPHRIRLAELRSATRPALFLPNYPPHDVFGSRPVAARRTRSLLYSGLLSVSRGAAIILDAAQRMPDVRFILLAKFMVPAEHKWFISEIAARNLVNIDFRGFIPFDQMPAELAAAGVGIMPWLPTPQHIRAAQPSKLYEYMACGLPIVAADLSITREVVAAHECGLLHLAGHVDDFVKKAYALLDDPNEARKMGDRGYNAFRKHYTYEKAGQELVEMYRSLLKRQGHAISYG